jgi:hypothetical protein
MKKYILFLLITVMICGGLSAQDVMPYPQSLQVGFGQLRITPNFSISLSGNPDDKTLENAANRFFKRLNAKSLSYFVQERIELNNKHGKSYTMPNYQKM